MTMMMMMMDVDKLTCDPSDAVDLLALADRYGIDELKRACAAMIEAYYDFEAIADCLNVLDVALRYSSVDLVRSCCSILVADVCLFLLALQTFLEILTFSILFFWYSFNGMMSKKPCIIIQKFQFQILQFKEFQNCF
jgi:hypothetical protein